MATILCLHGLGGSIDLRIGFARPAFAQAAKAGLAWRA